MQINGRFAAFFPDSLFYLLHYYWRKDHFGDVATEEWSGSHVSPSVGLSVSRSCHTLLFVAFLSRLKVEKWRHEYITDVKAPAQIITAPAKLVTAPTQPPTTKVVVYTALLKYLALLKAW